MKLYGFPTSLRVTVGVHEENQQFLEALQRVAASSVKAVR
jgi:histidinol-phosphate/aromatic aminotransferase/cobyric acid decarboxylase-like protein